MGEGNRTHVLKGHSTQEESTSLTHELIHHTSQEGGKCYETYRRSRRRRHGLLMQSCSSGVGPQHTIRLTNGEWSPYLSKHLPHYGYMSHIVTEAFALEGITVEYGWYPWARAFDYAKDGDWDGSIAWSKSSEREKVVLFSEIAIAATREMFFSRKDDQFDWQTLADLEGLRVGGVIGYVHLELLEAAWPILQAATML